VSDGVVGGQRAGEPRIVNCDRGVVRALSGSNNGVVGVDVEVGTIIERPPQAVASFAGDPTNAPEWYANIRSVQWRTPPPVGVGSRLAFVAQFLGRRLAYTYEVTELEPGSRLVMRTADGPFPMETTYTWEPYGETGTWMTLRNRGTPSGFSRLTAPMMEGAIRRATMKDLARLKTLLEAGASTS
jgi:uncharacterized protein YndB with AHSA1/START domain